MKKMKYLGVYLFMVAVVFANERVVYDGAKVYQLTPETEEQIQTIEQLECRYDVWRVARLPNSTIDVMVRPHQIREFEYILTESRIRSCVKVQNLQDLIDEDEKSRCGLKGEMDWVQFHPLEHIYKWLDRLTYTYKNVKMISSGRTFEGRDIKGVEINFGSYDQPLVVIDSGMHGREWIGPAATSWFIEQILQSKEDEIFRRFNYLYFPVVNPDGYVYSWKTDRLWKKTRTCYTSDSFERHVYGADPNRNFDSHWENVRDKTSYLFSGRKPNSEKGIRSYIKYMKKTAKHRQIHFYLTFHSFGNYLTYPWTWTQNSTAFDDKWKAIGEAAAAEWQAVGGQPVTVGQFSKVLYTLRGSSLDWFHETLNVTYPFMYYMRGSSYISPASDIQKAGAENLASVKEILSQYTPDNPEMTTPNVP